MLKIAVTNPKGGVGKTTTSVHLADVFARQGVRTLVVDADTQGHVSVFLGAKRVPGLARALTDLDTPLISHIQHNVRERLDVLSGDPATGTAARTLNGELGVELRLRKRLREVEDTYDVALIDVGPTVDLISSMALLAAQGVLVPVTPGRAIEVSVADLVARLTAMERAVDYAPRIIGLFGNMLDRRENLSRQLELFLQTSGQPVGPGVRKNTKIAEATREGKTVFEYAPDSPGAQDFEALARWSAAQLQEKR